MNLLKTNFGSLSKGCAAGLKAQCLVEIRISSLMSEELLSPNHKSQREALLPWKQDLLSKFSERVSFQGSHSQEQE